MTRATDQPLRGIAFAAASTMAYASMDVAVKLMAATYPVATMLVFRNVVVALAMVAFALAMTLNRRIRWNDASLGALVAAFPNSGFMGVPLLVALLGPLAAGPVILSIVVDMVITNLAVFARPDHASPFRLIEMAPGVTEADIAATTTAHYVV